MREACLTVANNHCVFQTNVALASLALLCMFFVPYPSKLHVGVCKPVWPSGCEGGGHCFFKQMYIVLFFFVVLQCSNNML